MRKESREYTCSRGVAEIGLLSGKQLHAEPMDIGTNSISIGRERRDGCCVFLFNSLEGTAFCLGSDGSRRQETVSATGIRSGLGVRLS